MYRTAMAAMLFASGVASAQHHECPMAHAAAEHQADVDHRHETTTGVMSYGTRHHFRLSPQGGSISLEVEDGQTGARDSIREHLQAIARAFAAGDFAMPMQIHAQVPPGVEVMKARRAEIRYDYSEQPNGGRVTISTRDDQALAAIHAFLRFQIQDHGTGDPTE